MEPTNITTDTTAAAENTSNPTSDPSTNGSSSTTSHHNDSLIASQQQHLNYPHLILKSNHPTLPRIIPLHPRFFNDHHHEERGSDFGMNDSSSSAAAASNSTRMSRVSTTSNNGNTAATIQLHESDAVDSSTGTITPNSHQNNSATQANNAYPPPPPDSFALLLGRHSSCTFTLNDPDKLLSRRHCLISYMNRKFYINDCGSLNKTLLNGKVVQFQQMKHGDVIVFAAVSGMSAGGVNTTLNIPFDSHFIDNVKHSSDKCIIYEVQLQQMDELLHYWAQHQKDHQQQELKSPLAANPNTSFTTPSVGEKRKRDISLIDSPATQPHHLRKKRRMLDDGDSTMPSNEDVEQSSTLQTGDSAHPSIPLNKHQTVVREYQHKLDESKTQLNSKTQEIQQYHLSQSELQSTLKIYQKNIQDLEGILQATKDRLNNSGQPVSRDALKQELQNFIQQELTCAICQNVLVDPVTLSCSHSFCKGCTVAWVHSKTENSEACLCPVCRVYMGGQIPIRNVMAETLLRKLLKLLEHDQFEKLIERIKQLRDHQKEAAKELDKMVRSAITQANSFMSIGTEWNEDGRKLFAQGIQNYTGDARIKYCELVGMDETWIQSASMKQMRIACRNLYLQEPYRRSPKNPGILQLFEEDLRRILSEFTKNELYSQAPFQCL